MTIPDSNDGSIDDATPPTKRQKADPDPSQTSSSSSNITLYIPPPITSSLPTTQNDEIRTSSLTAPTLKLTGHKSSVYATAYSPTDGDLLVSASFDMTCLLWNASSGNYENYTQLKGHKNAILDVKFTHHTGSSEFCVTASADMQIGYWDPSNGERVRRFMGHEGIVNSIDTSNSNPNMIVSASDDGTVRIWDVREKASRACVQILQTGDELGTSDNWAVTACCFGKEEYCVYSGGIDNLINAWDIRSASSSSTTSGGAGGSMTMRMKGHDDTITCLALHPKGTHLLSNSMDGTLKTWDIRPFMDDSSSPTQKKRHCKTFTGATHNAEKGLLNCAWNADGTMVTGGSADKIVHVWDELTAEELYYLPGHSGCVNSVIFHPRENVICSASSDKTIYVGELSS